MLKNISDGRSRPSGEEAHMKKNVGRVDSVVRIVLGGIAVAIGIFSSLAAGWRTAALVAGGVLIVTGIFGF